MNTGEFWHIIDKVHVESGGDMDQKCALLKQSLLDLDDQQLRDFINHFDSADAAGYTWQLWGAAYVMHGGCSDDAFDDFRATLISHGREVYERALTDPESLADLTYEDEEAICYEGFQYVPHEAAKEKLGDLPQRTVARPKDPAGQEWEEDSVEQLYPRLAAKYSGAPFPRSKSIPKKPWWRFW